MRKLSLLFLLFSICLLTSCVNRRTYEPPSPPLTDIASIKLAEAAVATTHSIQTLEAIRKVEVPDYPKLRPRFSSPVLNIMTAVDWTGPIGPLVERVAEIAHYRLIVLGRAPAIPVIVSIHKPRTTLGEILRDADYQGGAKAYVYFIPEKCVIELHYTNPCHGQPMPVSRPRRCC